ncbi:MAG: diguanylate cyclase, partial [Gammaproteobacteria bacterium]|nr:diguanylate cyclase [Gammaproteobacteria bacterium]
MALFGLMLGALVWQLLALLQEPALQQILNNELKQQLQIENSTSRSQFDRYLKQYPKITQLLAKQHDLIQYSSELLPSGSVSSSRRPPAWLQHSSSWHGLIHPSHIVLLDAQHRLREIYQLRKQALPSELQQPNAELLQLAKDQNYLTTLSDKPYLLTLSAIKNKQHTVAYLLLLAPLNSSFLRHSQHDFHGRKAIIALLSGYQQQTVFASSDPIRLPLNRQLSEVQTQFVVTGKTFFDYGSSDLKLRFSTLLSKDQINTLNANLIQLTQKQLLIASLCFIGAFIGLMLYYAARLKRLNRKTLLFSQQHLGLQTANKPHPDEMMQLEVSLKQLTQQVLKQQHEQKKRHSIDKKIKQFEILQTATESLGVGVILSGDIKGEGYAITQQMKCFAEDCGGIAFFLQQAEQHQQIECLDQHLQQRIFKLRWLSLANEQERVLLVQEETELVESMAMLEHQAQHDSLTGLPNRSLFMQRCQQTMNDCHKQPQHPFSLMMMDLDRFKAVNDTLGHHIGDQLLQQVSQRLSSRLRSNDTLARLGGDEFALLLPNTDAQQAKQVAELLQKQLKESFTLNQHSLSISTSIGIVTCPDHGKKTHILMQRADVAMYAAKRSQTGYCIYDPSKDPNSEERLQLINELSEAIEAEQLELYFQPQHDCQSGKTAVVEALLRWQHPRHGLLSPARFLALAEQNSLMIPLGKMVLKKAIQQCEQWNQQSLPLTVSVNLSAHSFQDDELLPYITQLLNNHHVEGRQLTLELTESSLMDNPNKARSLLTKLD